MEESWYDATIQNELPKIKKRLKQQSIREEDILLFCYGHALMDNFVTPFMDKIIELLKAQKMEEVKEEIGRANSENTINRLENFSQQNIKTKLTDSFKYLIYNSQHSKEMKVIKNRLQSQLS